LQLHELPPALGLPDNLLHWVGGADVEGVGDAQLPGCQGRGTLAVEVVGLLEGKGSKADGCLHLVAPPEHPGLGALELLHICHPPLLQLDLHEIRSVQPLRDLVPRPVVEGLKDSVSQSVLRVVPEIQQGSHLKSVVHLLPS